MFNLGWETLLHRLLLLIPLWLSLSVHEWAHAISAYWLGDDTAKAMGRMTVNPMAHVDPVGTLLLPLLGVPFGWARPVPVNPLRFRRTTRMQTGMLLTALAGPLANLGLALITIVLLLALGRTLTGPAFSTALIHYLLNYIVLINVILAIFNLIPVPPLDGGRILEALVPPALQPVWGKFRRFSPIVLIAILAMPLVTDFSLLDWPVRMILNMLQHLQL